MKKVKSPSLNPETPPLMVIKSHVIDKASKENTNTLQSSPEMIEMMKIKSKVEQPMSIKSKVLLAPKPAESMEIIMKKIREDFKNKEELSQDRQPTAKREEEKLKLDSVQQKAIVKTAKNDVIEFMKKIELMKEKETKSGQFNIIEKEVVTRAQD